MWIRSQDKDKLMKIQEVYLVTSNNEFRLYSDEVFLGQYNSKERALEVLDEIQEYIENEHMANLQKSKLLDSVYKNEISFNDFEGSVKKLKNVYEMPKE